MLCLRMRKIGTTEISSLDDMMYGHGLWATRFFGSAAYAECQSMSELWSAQTECTPPGKRGCNGERTYRTFLFYIQNSWLCVISTNLPRRYTYISLFLSDLPKLWRISHHSISFSQFFSVFSTLRAFLGASLVSRLHICIHIISFQWWLDPVYAVMFKSKKVSKFSSKMKPPMHSTLYDLYIIIHSYCACFCFILSSC